MKKNKKLLVSSLFLIASSLYSNEIDANLKKIEHSLSFKFVDVSKTDVNRIVCENGDIGKIVYSKDKELTIQKDGENAFIANSWNELVCVLNSLLDIPKDDYMAMCAKSREIYLSRFTFDMFKQKYLELFSIL